VSSRFRTVERAIVATILTTVPMIDSTIEWSALPLPQCRCSSVTICRQFAVIDETLPQARIWCICAAAAGGVSAEVI